MVKFGSLIIILPPKKAINNADTPIKLWAGRIKLGRANGSVTRKSKVKLSFNTKTKKTNISQIQKKLTIIQLF